MDGLAEHKAALRRRMREDLGRVGAAERARAAAALVEPLVALVRDRAGGVALFASLPSEIDTHLLDDALRSAGIPRVVPAIVAHELVFRALPDDVEARALAVGTFGVPTPPAHYEATSLASVDLVVTPGLAFDPAGGRLGYGRGYYDRALGRARQNAGGDGPRVIGIGLDRQLLDAVPMGPDDVRLDGVWTPSKGILNAGRDR